MKNQILFLLILSLSSACNSKDSDTGVEESTNTEDTDTEDTNTEDTNTEDTNTEDTDTEDTDTEDNVDPNIECTAHSDCDAGEFCAIECFTGDCGVNGDIPRGTLGQFCQPCVECEAGTDSITGDCGSCE